MQPVVCETLNVCLPLQNALSQPQEQKFRRLRRDNTAFQNRAGRFPAALQLLHLAGFNTTDQQQQQQQSASVASGGVLALQRDDPGLLWLVLSAITAAQTTGSTVMVDSGRMQA